MIQWSEQHEMIRDAVRRFVEALMATTCLEDPGLSAEDRLVDLHFAGSGKIRPFRTTQDRPGGQDGEKREGEMASSRAESHRRSTSLDSSWFVGSGSRSSCQQNTGDS